MKAAALHEHGGPEVLRYEDVTAPRPGPGQVRVRFVSVNRSLDVSVGLDGGNYHVTLPMVLGIDPSGVVEALGHGVTRFALGERVAVRLPHRGGGYAELVIADEARAYPIPGALSFAEATVVTRPFPAAFSLANAAVIREGEWMLVMGAQPPCACPRLRLPPRIDGAARPATARARFGRCPVVQW